MKKEKREKVLRKLAVLASRLSVKDKLMIVDSFHRDGINTNLSGNMLDEMTVEVLLFNLSQKEIENIIEMNDI
jgi:hypothetical protein